MPPIEYDSNHLRTGVLPVMAGVFGNSVRTGYRRVRRSSNHQEANVYKEKPPFSGGSPNERGTTYDLRTFFIQNEWKCDFVGLK